MIPKIPTVTRVLVRCNVSALLGANTYIQSCPPPSVILGIHLVIVISGDQHIPLHVVGRGLASKLPYTEECSRLSTDPHNRKSYSPHSASSLDQAIYEGKPIQPPNVLDECYNGSPPGIPGLTNGRTDKH